MGVGCIVIMQEFRSLERIDNISQACKRMRNNIRNHYSVIYDVVIPCGRFYSVLLGVLTVENK